MPHMPEKQNARPPLPLSVIFRAGSMICAGLVCAKLQVHGLDAVRRSVVGWVSQVQNVTPSSLTEDEGR